MPRITPNSTPDAKSQAMLDQVKKSLGSTPNIFMTMAHSPAVLGFYMGASGALKETKISAALREQIALTAAGMGQCDYCASAHTAIGKMMKLNEQELAHNLMGKSSDPKVQAALNFAGKVIASRGHIADADLQAVRSAGYSDAEVLEMIAVVALQLFTNYFNHVADTAVDFPLVSTNASPAKA